MAMRIRFLTFVAITAAIPFAIALLITAQAGRDAEGAFEQRLTAASSALESKIEADAAKHRELLLKMSLLAGVTLPVKAGAEAGKPPPPAAVQALRDAVM